MFPRPRSCLRIGLVRRVRRLVPSQACLFSTLRLNLVLTHGIPPDLGGGVHLFMLPYVIRPVRNLSGHAFITYRWRSLPRVCRHRASRPQGSSGFCLCRSEWTSNMRLYFPTPTLAMCLAFLNLRRWMRAPYAPKFVVTASSMIGRRTGLSTDPQTSRVQVANISAPFTTLHCR